MSGRRELERAWTRLGAEDPFWAVLTHKDKRGGRWDPGEFFATGEDAIAALLARVEELAPGFGGGRALDFGCGLGRLTRPLASRFDRVEGVDIAATMLDRARELHADEPRCVFRHLAAPGLTVFADASFDFALSLLVLQHMPRALALEALAALLRVLRPGGVLVVQAPTHPRTLKARLRAVSPSWLWSLYTRARYGHAGVMAMHGLAEAELRAAIRAGGARVLAVDEDGGGDWRSLRYIALKGQ